MATQKIEHKSFPITEFKVLDAEQGIVEAIVAVFNKEDYERDIIEIGFFADAIASERLPKGIWQHDLHDPIIKTLEAKELAPGDMMLPEKLREFGGLYVKGQCNMQVQRGREAFEHLRFGTIDEFSIGYIATEKKYVGRNRHLYKGMWLEWSLVTIGMHPDTVLMSVKEAKVGKMSKQQISVKGMFEDMLKTRTLTFWNLSNILDCVLYQIDNQEEASDRLGLDYDYEGMVRQACAEFTERLVEGRLKEEAAEEAAGAEGDTGEMQTDGTGVMMSMKEARQADSRGLGAYLSAVADAVEGAAERARARREMRTKEGRMLSTATDNLLADISQRARALADEIDQLRASNAKEDQKPADTGLLLKQLDLKAKQVQIALLGMAH